VLLTKSVSIGDVVIALTRVFEIFVHSPERYIEIVILHKYLLYMVAIWFYFETCAATLQKLTRRAVAQMKKKKGLELTTILCIVPLYTFVNRTASNDTQL